LYAIFETVTTRLLERFSNLCLHDFCRDFWTKVIIFRAAIFGVIFEIKNERYGLAGSIYQIQEVEIRIKNGDMKKYPIWSIKVLSIKSGTLEIIIEETHP